MSLYMAITSDRYELPLAVGTAAEVARWAGCKTATIYSYVSGCKKCNGKRRGYNIIKV